MIAQKSHSGKLDKEEAKGQCISVTTVAIGRVLLLGCSFVSFHRDIYFWRVARLLFSWHLSILL